MEVKLNVKLKVKVKLSTQPSKINSPQNVIKLLLLNLNFFFSFDSYWLQCCIDSSQRPFDE